MDSRISRRSAICKRLTKKHYVEPLEKVRNDWTVIEIKDANHFTCILKQQFREEIASWLQKNAT